MRKSTADEIRKKRTEELAATPYAGPGKDGEARVLADAVRDTVSFISDVKRPQDAVKELGKDVEAERKAIVENARQSAEEYGDSVARNTVETIRRIHNGTYSGGWEALWNELTDKEREGLVSPPLFRLTGDTQLIKTVDKYTPERVEIRVEKTFISLDRLELRWFFLFPEGEDEFFPDRNEAFDFNPKREIWTGDEIRIKVSGRFLEWRYDDYITVHRKDMTAEGWGEPVWDAQVVDRGEYAVGERYYYKKTNPVTGVYEISDVWRYGNRWRCPRSMRATESNGPGFYGSWPLVSGDMTVRLRTSLDDNPAAAIIAHGVKVDVDCRLMAGKEDITDKVRRWSIERKGEDMEADQVWNNAHGDFQGSVTLGAEDFGFLARKGVFQIDAWYPSSKPADDIPEMTYARLLIK